MGTLYISSTKKLEVYNKAIILLVSILFFPLTVSSNDDGNLYIYFKDGRVEAFPNNWITSRSISGGVLRMDINGNYFNYSTNEFQSANGLPHRFNYLQKRLLLPSTKRLSRVRSRVSTLPKTQSLRFPLLVIPSWTEIKLVMLFIAHPKNISGIR